MAVARRVVSSVAIAALVALAGCGGDDVPDSCLPGCAADRGYDAIAYHLSARFDDASLTLTAVEDLTLLPALPIVELDADVEVAKVHAGGKPLAFVNDRAAGTLHVDLGPIVGDGGPVDFTVEYTAGTSDALVLAGPRDDDPVPSTVLYTDSEPDRGLRWLVAKHDPSDRALWSVDVTMPTWQDAVANGTRAGDQPVGGEHLVSYHLDQPIPTYLMAFARGELDHVERTTGRVPLGLWFRRGLLIDPDDNLDVVADAMATYEGLIGPYPWERYSVVLLPGFGGGMENATITFNDEGSGQGAVSFSLNAHELAHHWFGDWVTMRGYDDVWVKEGMATFLAAEATRATRDAAGAGRSFATDFRFFAGDAIVDPGLTGLSKYTSGPYQRAAWLITQIRALVGEDAFWAGLRTVLSAHAVGDVDGAEFIGSFGLPPATAQRLRDSLVVTGVPAVDVTATTAAGATTATITLLDPGNLLAAPVELAVIDAAGAATTTTLAIGNPTTFTVPDGGYFAPEPRGVHPWSSTFDVASAWRTELRPRYFPTAAAAVAALTQGSASHQEIALAGAVTLPPPSELAAFYAALDSTFARRAALTAACLQHRTLPPAEAAALADVLRVQLASPPVVRYGNLSACSPALSEQVFGAELATLEATAATAARLDYLMSFDYGASASLARMSRIAAIAPSLRLRDLALDRLVNQTYDFTGYTPPSDLERPDWATFFRTSLPGTTSQRRLALLWAAVVNLGDAAALPIVAPLLHSVAMADELQLQIVCDAHAIAAPAEWTTFQAATMPWSTLSAGAAAALADPSTCPTFKRAAPPRADRGDDGDDHLRGLRADSQILEIVDLR